MEEQIVSDIRETFEIQNTQSPHDRKIPIESTTDMILTLLCPC
jgi:hypothetical protein